MFCWGIINMCMGFVQSYQSLVALRALLGVFEAGVMPGCIYLTSMYYKRHEFQKRMSFFFGSTLVGGAFGGVSSFDPRTFRLPFLSLSTPLSSTPSRFAPLKFTHVMMATCMCFHSIFLVSFPNPIHSAVPLHYKVPHV